MRHFVLGELAVLVEIRFVEELLETLRENGEGGEGGEGGGGGGGGQTSMIVSSASI
jgi:hypothetical protein